MQASEIDGFEKAYLPYYCNIMYKARTSHGVPTPFHHVRGRRPAHRAFEAHAQKMRLKNRTGYIEALEEEGGNGNKVTRRK